MYPFKRSIPDGDPWIDYKEATKTGAELRFFFPVDNFMYFLLREMNISFPCGASGVPRLPLLVKANVESASRPAVPLPIPPEVFSSPCENFNLGTLDENPQGFRMRAYTWNYPFYKGDFLTVTVSGVSTGFVIGCMINGTKIQQG